jgi:hypothetical protein
MTIRLIVMELGRFMMQKPYPYNALTPAETRPTTTTITVVHDGIISELH